MNAPPEKPPEPDFAAMANAFCDRMAINSLGPSARYRIEDAMRQAFAAGQRAAPRIGPCEPSRANVLVVTPQDGKTRVLEGALRAALRFIKSVGFERTYTESEQRIIAIIEKALVDIPI